MPKDKKLTKRQEAMLGFITSFIDASGYPPTIREIGKACSITSTSVVNYNLNKLEREGFLARDREISRGLRLSDIGHQSNIVRIPLAGRIAASEPVSMVGGANPFAEGRTIEVTRDIVEAADDLFALEVRGDSMVDAMIGDSDIVIMRPHYRVQNGDLVAVWLTDREETTLKYIYFENDRIRLQPANPTMKPIYIANKESVQVQGKVVAVIRRV